MNVSVFVTLISTDQNGMSRHLITLEPRPSWLSLLPLFPLCLTLKSPPLSSHTIQLHIYNIQLHIIMARPHMLAANPRTCSGETAQPCLVHQHCESACTTWHSWGGGETTPQWGEGHCKRQWHLHAERCHSEEMQGGAAEAGRCQKRYAKPVEKVEKSLKGKHAAKHTLHPC